MSTSASPIATSTAPSRAGRTESVPVRAMPGLSAVGNDTVFAAGSVGLGVTEAASTATAPDDEATVIVPSDAVT